MKKGYFVFFIIVSFLISSCQPIQQKADQISLQIIHDGQEQTVKVSPGLTVKQILDNTGISLNSLDKTTPALEEMVNTSETIHVIRVKESLLTEESTLPFESQTIKNESLPVGQTLLIQPGVNGIQTNTIRVVTEDGVEVSKTIIKSEVTKAAQPEIVMIGIQSPYKSVDISGVLGYISSSNAWIMETNTGSRREVVSTGDLDGRIFSLSADHQWLLFSRSGSKTEPDIINSLWVVKLSNSPSDPIPLGINNVVHYAEWVPGKTMMIAYSTVEPRSTAPGWQANNDLKVMSFTDSGKSIDSKTLVDTNSGGIYGWWGTTYLWSPDASEIAYARPDSIGLVDSKSGSLNSLIEFTPYQTSGDWAWVPGISWDHGHDILFTVLPENTSGSASVSFNLEALLVSQSSQINLQSNTGMFAYPAISPLNGNSRYSVAFLSAALPDQSQTSRYELRVMDRDGSNMKKLYPEEGVQGLDPQQVVWSPIDSSHPNSKIAFIAQGNLMFVNPITGNLQQITGDGSLSKIDWK